MCDPHENSDAERIQSCALVVSVIGSFLTAFMSSSINIALPAIGSELSMDAVMLSWISTAFLLAAAVFLVPFGRLADIYGRKRIFGYGIALFTLASILAPVSRSASMIIAARFVQGVGAAMIFGTAVAILTSVFPLRKRGRVIGINAASVYLGLSLGPVLGGILTQYLGWRSLFVATVPIGALALALLMNLRGEWADARGERFDLSGSLVYGISIMALVYGMSLLPSSAGRFVTVAGLAGLVLFLYLETKAENPVIEVDLFKSNRVFALSNLAALINYSATFATGFLLSLYLQYIKALDPRSAGLVLLAQPLMMTILSPLTGRLSDRMEPRLVASAGMAITLLSIVPFVFLDERTPVWFIGAVLLLLGFGLALFTPPNTNAIMSSVERKYYGIASATLGTMRLLGQMLSMSLAMVIFAIYIGRVEITPDTYSSLIESSRIAFAIFSVLCFIGIFASLARGELRGGSAATELEK
ncbi:MAG: MFS transporter [Methanothrix sp.]|uniref:Major facilitator superfamily MFS_1 n=1 Tax=Methanothrix thermoacetophila (strain DSM 6194 / JCM 14653 / NBRC 101360 / PT) TaxID=349307 RepID=A0B5Z4_METTP|nr:major facilitator superfamily MFS_1 [Methanothrix thermoacetophila PT]MBC7079778.1 MFS transporter [Methanothrix sp.]NPU87855.1 MFS transporter [Methanothrix sp.]